MGRIPAELGKLTDLFDLYALAHFHIVFKLGASLSLTLSVSYFIEKFNLLIQEHCEQLSRRANS